MNKINILYTCDNAYLSLTSISMASVIQRNPDSCITFYIATESEDDNNFRKLKNFYKDNGNIAIKYVDCKKYDYLLEINSLDTWGSPSYYVYWKLFAYDFIDEDEIWYLDSDVICMDKVEYPVINRSVGAVLDSAHAIFNKTAHIEEDYYLFNTGSLYVNIKKWKENKCVEKVVNYLENMKYKPILCDQDILAIALQKDIEVINPKFNYFVGYDYYGVHNSYEMYSLNSKPFYKEEEIEKAKDKVMFYHFLGGVFGRPWEDNNFAPRKELFDLARSESAWPDYKKDRNMSTLFKIEHMLEVLPKFIYNRIHNFAMRKYVEGLGK